MKLEPSFRNQQTKSKLHRSYNSSWINKIKHSMRITIQIFLSNQSKLTVSEPTQTNMNSTGKKKQISSLVPTSNIVGTQYQIYKLTWKSEMLIMYIHTLAININKFEGIVQRPHPIVNIDWLGWRTISPFRWQDDLLGKSQPAQSRENIPLLCSRRLLNDNEPSRNSQVQFLHSLFPSIYLSSISFIL